METRQEWFDTDEILEGILSWARIESPTYHAAGVNSVPDLAELEMTELGGDVSRTAGTQGFGDIVTAKFNGEVDRQGAGILVLAHVDTVHNVGTLDGRLPIRREGEKVFGPGVLDMKGGGRLAVEAFKAISRASLKTRLPVTFMFTPDEEIGSPTSRDAIEA
ncbi:MAG: M20/M25/M40 family metallo-hydrolase, partial [Hyphomicrobiaceae bacterium]